MHCPPAYHLCAVACAWALTGAAIALPPQAAAQTVYYACYVPRSGAVYRIREYGVPRDCIDPAHVQFKWNEQGPQGPQGPAGGLAGYEAIQSPVTPVPAGSGQIVVTARCPVGKVALGGGYSLGGDNGGRNLRVQYASVDNNRIATMYSVAVSNDASTVEPNGRVYVMVTCAIAQ
jgi:hypothetical protein